jgi:DNA-binding transcriptional ArsR family regulator
MAVKRSRSAGRMLQVFEALARLQPTGVSALARELEADKSAVQRDLMTLADAEWIRTVPASAGQWELSPHILSIARPPHSVEALRRQARPVLERLRSDLGETAYLAVPDGENSSCWLRRKGIIRCGWFRRWASSSRFRAARPAGSCCPIFPPMNTRVGWAGSRAPAWQQKWRRPARADMP